MVNLGPDEPFGGLPSPPFADPDTTGQVMKFQSCRSRHPTTSRPPDRLTLPAFRPLGDGVEHPPGVTERAGEHIRRFRRSGRGSAGNV